MAKEVDSNNVEVTEAQIAAHWKEEEYYRPSAPFIAQANLVDPNVMRRFSIDKFPENFREYADMLDWFKYWDTTLDSSNPPFWRWFVGGLINASHNCVDRHLKHHRGKAALIFIPEPENDPPVVITYQELFVRMNEVAALLKDFAGLKQGDRVTIHMPMVPELPITMLACARLGIIHSVVFGGFSGSACGDRIADSGSTVLITMDGYHRNGKWEHHKDKADQAVAHAKALGTDVKKVLVWARDRAHFDTSMVPGRDFLMNDFMNDYRDARVDPVPMPAESPLFLMYTSGTTGKPKGIQHSTGGYLAYVTGTSKYVLDIHPEDIYWCMADIGWITGHSYIVYGPLSLGTTSVIYEGVPTYPDGGRPWRIAQRLGVNIFHTAPTAVRQLRKMGPEEPRKYNYHFKLMVTVGEPIEPDVWRWYYEEVGKREAVIVDTWWQTENGGFLCSTKPALDPMKPGSTGPGVPGINPVVLDENGNELPPGSQKAGNICIRNPWPGIMQTIWGDPDRYVQTYYAKYCRDPKSKDWRDWPYFAGDGALYAADSYIRILGRVDDVINVAGHRLGTKELESACLTVEGVAEAAVVPTIDAIKGRSPEVYVSLKPDAHRSEESIRREVQASIEDLIGKFARPKQVWIVEDMPKTRSGKIMRRVLAAISNRMPVGDVTTLANPEVVERIKTLVESRSESPRHAEAGDADDIRRFGQTD